MKFNFNDVESEREKNKKFAEKNGISLEEMDEVYTKIYEELPENLTGDKRELRALRKTRGSLRQKANRTGTELDGFILMRFRDKDFERNAWNKVDTFINDNGKEDAIQKGMLNDKGEYLHTAFTTSFSDQHGKVINKDNVIGQAVGIVVNDNTQELRFLTIGKYNVFDKIPLCREVSLIIKEGNQPAPLFPDRNGYFLNGVKLTGSSSNAYYSDEEFEAYVGLIEELCGDIIYDTKEEIDQYAQANRDNRFNFIAVPTSSVIRIGAPLDNGSVPIDIELDDGSITVWADKNVFKDLTIEEGIAGVALVNTYINNNDEAGYRIGGFLPYM